MSVHKKFSPIGPAVWPAIGNIDMNVLFYYFISDYVVRISIDKYKKEILPFGSRGARPWSHCSHKFQVAQLYHVR
jgi:hypothetical protein